MKKKHFAFLSAMVLLLSVTMTQLFSLELTFACENAQDFPTVMGNSDKVLDKNPGMGIDACRELEKKLGIKITIIRLPWQRCLESLKTGEVDGIFTASYKDERKEYGNFPEKDGKVDASRRYSSISYALYKNKGSNIGYDGNKFLNINGKVGAPRGYSIVDDLKKKGLEIDEGQNTKSDFLKLVNNRLAAVAALEQTGDYLLKKEAEFTGKIEKVLPIIVEKPYYFMLSRQFCEKNKDMSEKIWNAIRDIREDEKFQMKLGNYLE